ncbi:MAG: RNA polymerase sigma factor, partial [Cyclobacteriaceae bacterium]
KAKTNGDQKAYGKLMLRYRKPVYHTILKMVKNQSDAEDLTIEAFAKAFKNLSKFNPDYTFSTWLFRIATNNCIDFIRKKRLNTLSINSAYTDDNGDSVGIDIQDTGLNPQEEAIKKQKIEIMKIIVTQLPAKYQALIRLRYFSELSYDEIATELDSPLGTVKAQLHRAREILSNMMKGKRDKI